MKIGVILGSIREGRAGKPVADWVMGRAQQRTGVDYELVDVADYDLPMLDAGMPGMVSDGDYGDERVNRWAAKIAEFDGFVFVTAEYNHGIPGAFKKPSTCWAPSGSTRPLPSSATALSTVLASSRRGAWCWPTSRCTTSAARSA